MAVVIQWNEKALDPAKTALAKRILAAAVMFETAHKERLSKHNPPPYLDSSKPGEYPRARTGFGRANVMHEPTSITDVERKLEVKIGETENAQYMLILELFKDRLGLQKTLEEMKAQLAAYVVSAEAER